MPSTEPGVLDDLLKFATTFRGLSCRSVSTGGVGAAFFIECERVRTSNAVLDAVDRQQQSQNLCVHMIESWCASWRIEDRIANKVLATSAEENPPNGLVSTTLQRFVGATITEMVIDLPGLDCDISFDSGLGILIFPVGVDSYCSDNYSLWGEDFIYCVGGKSVVSRSARKDVRATQL